MGRVANEVQIFASISLSEMLRNVNGAAAQSIQKQLNAFVRAWKYKWQRRGGITSAHQRAAEKAHTAIINNSLKAIGINADPDDKNRSTASGVWKRYSGGQFQLALADPANIQATVHGVGIINRPHMDRTAKQWYRLQFGATGTGGAPDFADTAASHRQRIPIGIFGKTLGYLDLRRFPASQAFEIPAGVFEGDNYKHMFTPFAYMVQGQRGKARKKQLGALTSNYMELEKLVRENPEAYTPYDLHVIPRAKIASGIPKYNYLAEGLVSLSLQLRKEWENIFKVWFTEAAQEGRSAVSPVAKAGISPAAARRLLRSVPQPNRGGRGRRR